MMLPPKQDDLAARMDPTKIRARKFNTGRGARAPNQGGGGIDGVWTETPEQKRKRLENEVLGIAAPAAAGGSDTSRDHRKDAEAEETARRIGEYNVGHLPNLRSNVLANPGRSKHVVGHCMNNTKPALRRTRRTIQVRGLSTERRILLVV
mgnify:CR=1 FL=1